LPPGLRGQLAALGVDDYASLLGSAVDFTVENPFIVDGAGEYGAVRLGGARIGGQLVLIRAEICNPTGPALIADGLQTEGDAAFKGDFTGEGGLGAVRLAAARIGGQLHLTDGKIRNPTGPALFG
jgi:hypothetical protein